MSLFIKQIADSLAGQVAFSLPTGNGYANVVGFLSEDPVIKMANRFEPLIPDLGSINEFTQLANIGQTSWISTSKMSWKSTDPITVTLNFYLITYLKSQVDGNKSGVVEPVSKQATYFAKLVSLSQTSDGGGALGIGVNVHGGYKPNYFQDNSNNFLNNGNILALKKLDNNGAHLSEDDEGNHTCHIVINGNGKPSVVLKNMLLESLDMTPSTVRAGYWNGISNKGISQSATFVTSSEPLYIKVNAGFKLRQVARDVDVADMFGGSYSG